MPIMGRSNTFTIVKKTLLYLFIAASIIGFIYQCKPAGAGNFLTLQAVTDAPNHANFSSALLLPGKRYSHITIYVFKADNQ